MCNAIGVADFELLHSREHDRLAFLYAFDLLELDGVDLRPFPLERRKDQLRILLLGYTGGIQFSEHLEGDGATVFAHACRLGCEGIVSKDRSRPYKSGPSKTWIKVKNPDAPGMRRFEDRLDHRGASRACQAPLYLLNGGESATLFGFGALST